ncbi:hypothetical protein GV791_29090 [Nocardia cyriacigeorgica]|jgi:hypothetical protein|uniref:Uncharacterized protein n=1 Tax=Nocardia cyriacigeorgica TaxID=135487 RepID=A0A6P1CYG7_9NOCA|nr:hypothetical protein [Nocardia cyriacigeorgica]MBF6083174.1 hypothetical protein [Nocardia cyriacigeorgica]MBF6326886.1 hypothetical protein [Nocardia cyriacigeorgica]MBF6427059.1 hypothetical protein [Nocardia cyriacigeorgica]NEW36584.1 hypothetical protein [Nocardia cyriacigeorgica]BDU05476.1 hypothetical protein FMUBM48_17390 [Nocardia cyriacigeorgica]
MPALVIRPLVHHGDAGVSEWTVPTGYAIAIGLPLLVIAATIWWPHD